MNYLKWGLYALIITLFFQSLMGMASFNVSVFADSFFTSTGFIATFVFVLVELYFAVYALEYGRKKEVEENRA